MTIGIDPARPELDPDRLRAALGGRWSRVVVVPETESTNADLLADRAAPDRSVLVAEHQISGRGRLDRVWVSPPRAGLTFSVLVRPTAPIGGWGWLPLLAGVALHAAVGRLAGVPVRLKWPNDLLAGEPLLKTAGILAQTSGTAVVIGIGLNVSTSTAELPVVTATSLTLAGAPALDRSSLLIAVLQEFDALYTRWSDTGGDAEGSGLAPAYRAACATIGQLVTVTSIGGAPIQGTATGVDGIGRLRVDVGGVEQVIGAGDVQHLRPG